MVSSSSSSSSPSFKRCHKKLTCLSSLPDELLVEISSYVGASSSLSSPEIINLQLVSKSFQRICNHKYILRRLPAYEVRRIIWSCNHADRFSQCVESENPEALYSKGHADYFHQDSDEQRRDRAIGYLAKASEGGNQKAQYLYGMISICLGGKAKQKGLKILSSLTKPLVSCTMKEMESFRKEIGVGIWCRDITTQLKGSYVREKCRCDGRTEKFMEEFVWRRHDAEMITSSACKICLWHHEVQLFLHNI